MNYQKRELKSAFNWYKCLNRGHRFVAKGSLECIYLVNLVAQCSG